MSEALTHMHNMLTGKAICGQLIIYPEHLWTPNKHEVTCLQCVEILTANKCNPETGHHTSPHKGCILR
jgi:hypothetical protein